MARKSYIRGAIRTFVEKNSVLFVQWPNWYVGITNNINKRLGQHQSKLGRQLQVFNYWEAEHVDHAVDLEKEFLEMGMKGAGGGWAQNSFYIYVYKLKGPGA